MLEDQTPEGGKQTHFLCLLCIRTHFEIGKKQLGINGLLNKTGIFEWLNLSLIILYRLHDDWFLRNVVSRFLSYLYIT